MSRVPDATVVWVRMPTRTGGTLARVVTPSLSGWISRTAGAADVITYLAMLIEEHGEAVVMLAVAAALVMVQHQRRRRG